MGDIRLGYLDWGGHGPPLLLLPGLGDTPHVFDSLAPRLTGCHRVLGLNRRGHGDSGIPRTSYDPQSLASDLAGFLRALDLDCVTLVGHSIAGNEMTALAAKGEPRLTSLIYLDAAYDRRGTSERAQEHFGFWNDSLEANLRARLRLNQGGNLNAASAFVARSIMEASEGYSPSYDRVKVPSLALYAPFGDDHWAPCDHGDSQLRGAVPELMRNVMRP